LGGIPAIDQVMETPGRVMNEPVNAATIVGVSVHDVRFPTSDDLDGSDTVHSAAG